MKPMAVEGERTGAFSKSLQPNSSIQDKGSRFALNLHVRQHDLGFTPPQV